MEVATMPAGDETSLAIASRHVRQNLVPAVPSRRCIDPRYEPGQGSGTIARPGADLGYVLALLAVSHARELGLTPATALNAVYDAVTADGGTFSIHTDEVTGLPDARTAPVPLGCRHVVASADPARTAAYFPPTYHAAAGDVRSIVDEIVRRARSGGRVQVITLRGESADLGVLVVTGTRRTVNPLSAESSYFVYDRVRDEAFITETLVPRLDIAGLTAEDLIAASHRQCAASLAAVAAGKPLFLVDADGSEPIVTLAGRIGASDAWKRASGLDVAR